MKFGGKGQTEDKKVSVQFGNLYARIDTGMEIEYIDTRKMSKNHRFETKQAEMFAIPSQQDMEDLHMASESKCY